MNEQIIKVGSHTMLDIEIADTKKMKEEYDKQKAKKKVEVKIKIDDEVAEMTLAEFKKRIFKKE